MSRSHKQQALIEAPVRDVWDLIADPARFPDWTGTTIEVTGVPTHIEKGSTFDQMGRGPLGMKAKTTYAVDELEDLKEIKLRCTLSGWYSHWTLTEARGDTFVDVEMGIEQEGVRTRVVSAGHTRGFMRRVTDGSIDGLRQQLEDK